MEELQGGDLRRAFAEASHCLELYRDAINALNVFPVPDGDTGTNMLLTMRSALEKCPEAADADAGAVASGLADGAFWGARGNSGVILSQLFRGFADALGDEEVCDGPGLRRALNLATEAAYRSVAQPVEGTMLSVIRAASIAVQDGTMPDGPTPSGGVSVLLLWERAFQAAAEALRLTPTQLPILKQAGVVDAGGMGVVVILGGALCSLTGREPDLIDQAVGLYCIEPVTATPIRTSIDSDYLDSTLDSTWGYCIQYIIAGADLSVEGVREGLGTEMAQSTAVVGDDRHIRVHLHASDPGPALSYGASLGELDQIKIENMGHQNTDFVAGHRPRDEQRAKLAVVAVAQGDGFARLFKDAGCAGVIPGGQTMNPSVGEFLISAQSSGAEDIIILPNNPNVVSTAQQSAKANPGLHVVPSTTIPQGVAALLAFSPEKPLEQNLRAMTDALSGVATIEVTKAVRSSAIGGVTVDAGQYIGLLDGELVTSGDTPERALSSAIDRVVHSPDQVVTLYPGAEASAEAVEELGRRLGEAFPGIQVDVVYGGQPHYDYLASVE